MAGGQPIPFPRDCGLNPTIDPNIKLQYMLLPGYIMHEYKLVIPLPEALEARIYQLRQDFGAHYQYKADPGRPHLTLVSFSQVEMMEERILQRLKTIGMGASPFKVELRDFGAFPTHTIYVNVATKNAVRELMRSVKDIQKLLKTDADHKPYFLQDPVISIARKLKPWQFEKGWLEYSHRHFTGRFVADGILLLKRRDASRPWQILQRIEFKSLPVAMQQQSLLFETPISKTA